MPLVKSSTRRLNHILGCCNYTARDIKCILYNLSLSLKIIGGFCSGSVPFFFLVLVARGNRRNNHATNEGGNQGGYTAGIQDGKPERPTFTRSFTAHALPLWLCNEFTDHGLAGSK